jgi:predicted naringenin-chalcone synthase
MSSPTVLFVLKRILDEIKADKNDTPKKIFACAFGPGITVEMINMSSVKFSENKPGSANLSNAVQ